MVDFAEVGYTGAAVPRYQMSADVREADFEGGGGNIVLHGLLTNANASWRS